MFRLLSHHNVDTVIDVGADDAGYGRFLRNGGSEAIFFPLSHHETSWAVF
jgi:hypothetical protein